MSNPVYQEATPARIFNLDEFEEPRLEEVDTGEGILAAGRSPRVQRMSGVMISLRFDSTPNRTSI